MSPSELMFGRQLNTRFDLLQPQLDSKVVKRQQKQKQLFDRQERTEILLLVILCMYVISQKKLL